MARKKVAQSLLGATPDIGYDPVPVFEPLGLGTTSRYGITGLGMYRDHSGNMALYPVIGGVIQFQASPVPRGVVDVAVVPEVNYDSTEFKSWLSEVDRVAQLMITEFRGICKATSFAEKNFQLDIMSQWDLQRFIDSSAWKNIIEDVYLKFPRHVAELQYDEKSGLSGYRERYYVASFNDGPVQSFMVTKEGIEISIQPPDKSDASQNRIRVNKACWLAFVAACGYKTKTAPFWYRYFDKLMKTGTRITSETILELYAKRGVNPIDSIEKESPEAYFVKLLMLARMFDQISKVLKLEEWWKQLEWSTIAKGVTDAQLATLVETIYSPWSQTQVRVPDGDLPSKDTLRLLPVGNAKYSRATNREPPGLEGAPCVYISELEMAPFVAKPKDAPQCELTRLKCVNACEHVEIMSYNRVYGSVFGSNLDDECIGLIAVVFPVELYLRKRDTMGMKYERRHWPVLYQQMNSEKPLYPVVSARERFLYGCKSMYGPNYYLVDTSDWIQDELVIKTVETLEGGKTHVVETRYKPNIFATAIEIVNGGTGNVPK